MRQRGYRNLPVFAYHHNADVFSCARLSSLGQLKVVSRLHDATNTSCFLLLVFSRFRFVFLNNILRTTLALVPASATSCHWPHIFLATPYLSFFRGCRCGQRLVLCHKNPQLPWRLAPGSGVDLRGRAYHLPQRWHHVPKALHQKALSEALRGIIAWNCSQVGMRVPYPALIFCTTTWQRTLKDCGRERAHKSYRG